MIKSQVSELNPKKNHSHPPLNEVAEVSGSCPEGDARRQHLGGVQPKHP